MSCSCAWAALVLPDLTAKQGLRLLAAQISVLTEPSLLPALHLSLLPCTGIIPRVALPFKPSSSLACSILHALLLCCHQPDSRGCSCPSTDCFPSCIKSLFIYIKSHVIHHPKKLAGNSVIAIPHMVLAFPLSLLVGYPLQV